MAIIAFDTLKFAKRLKDAGILPAQAEAEAEALAEVLESTSKNRCQTANTSHRAC